MKSPRMHTKRPRRPKSGTHTAGLRALRPFVPRRGMTLLETLLALSLLSVVSIAVVLGTRTTWQAWSVQDLRSDSSQHLSGLLNHVTRYLRQTRSVVSVSAAADTTGYISIRLPDDSVVKWDHDDATGNVVYGVDPPSDLLAIGIDALQFECFERDGVTPTVVLADIRMIRTTASITVPVQGTSFSLSSQVWLRKQQDALEAEYVDFHPTTTSGSHWQDNAKHQGPPDDLFSSNCAHFDVHYAESSGFDTTGYSGSVGTVLVGLYLKTSAPLGDDSLEVRVDLGSAGPVRSFGQAELLQYENNADWLWVDVTDDFGGWTYTDIGSMALVHVSYDSTASTSHITFSLDAVALRTFVAAPQTQSFWLSAVGASTEWQNRPNAIGPPDGTYAKSYLYSLTDWDIDRQDYLYPTSWQDLGTIVRVRLLISDFYMDSVISNDQFHVRMPLTSEPIEYDGDPVPLTAHELPKNLLNLHVGSGNLGSTIVDCSNLEDWTWTGLRSRLVRLYASSIDVPETEINIDGVAVEVRYVPPPVAAVVQWEEL